MQCSNSQACLLQGEVDEGTRQSSPDCDSGELTQALSGLPEARDGQENLPANSQEEMQAAQI